MNMPLPRSRYGKEFEDNYDRIFKGDTMDKPKIDEIPISAEMHQRLERSFMYHAPKADQPERYIALREKAKELAHMICAYSQPSREQSTAITKLEECIMWVNKGIAVNE